MRKTLYFSILFFTVNILFSQDIIITEKNIPKLNTIIKNLEKEYSKTKRPIYKSQNQTSANYFKIITQKPDEFVTFLEGSKSIKELESEFSGLQVDKDLLLIKISNTLISFSIGNSEEHWIDFDSEIELSGKSFYYSSSVEHYHEEEGLTTIQGFYLNEPFDIYSIPKKYAEWRAYSDYLIKPEVSVYKKNANYNYDDDNFEKTILDSLENYYKQKINEKSLYWSDFYIKTNISDSLYKYDSHFKKLLKTSLAYAEKNKKSNSLLENLTAQLISEKRTLNLIRETPVGGSCSQDLSPIYQQKKIAELAANTLDWPVFIKAFLNVLNDNVSRVAYSSFSSNEEVSYVDELLNLDLDINKIFMGTNLKILDNNLDSSYYSDGNKTTKIYSHLNDEYKRYFEKNVYEILKNKSVDPFNKLNFYNIIRSYQYQLKDSVLKKTIEFKTKKHLSFLPKEIRSRIENPDKELYDLLYKEKEDLDKFEILDSSVRNTFKYMTNEWIAKLIEKNGDNQIVFDLKMSIKENITPLKNFIIKKEEFKQRIKSNKLIQNILAKDPESKLFLNFTEDKSFVNYKNREIDDIPEILAVKSDFNNAISFSINGPIDYILLNNNNLILKISKGMQLPGHNEKDLIFKDENPGSYSYGYKLLNEKGEVIN